MTAPPGTPRPTLPPPQPSGPTHSTPSGPGRLYRGGPASPQPTLSDEDATARANLIPSGTRFGWVLTTDPKLAPVPCDDNPETHRHLIFEC